MNFESIIENLKEKKIELEKLKGLSFQVGESDVESIKKRIAVAIRRIYPDYEKIQKDLISTYPGWSDDPGLKQKYYQETIITLIDAIDTIVEEFEIYGFDDFKSVKEKIETEGGIKTGFFNIKRKITREK